MEYSLGEAAGRPEYLLSGSRLWPMAIKPWLRVRMGRFVLLSTSGPQGRGMSSRFEFSLLTRGLYQTRISSCLNILSLTALTWTRRVNIQSATARISTRTPRIIMSPTRLRGSSHFSSAARVRSSRLSAPKSFSICPDLSRR